ncbi:MAG: zinc ribbon domain-containing protein [Bryobacterales bacterium]|nr:zinc ribbon domain-containing protein [Bryobacterales bacterium]
MFTWICPKCGAEVPPHENECPRCLKEQLATAQQIAVPPQPPPPQGPPPPPQAPYPPYSQGHGYPGQGQPPYPPQGYPPQPYPPPYGQQPQPYPPHTQAYPPQPPPQGQPGMLTSQMMPSAAPPAGSPTAYTQPPPPPAYAPPQENYNTAPLPGSAPPPPAPPPPPVSHRPLPVKDAFSNAPPPPPPSQGLPSWAIVLLVAALLIGAGYAGITYFSGSPGTSATEDKRRDKMEPVTKDAAANPFAKHLELTGIRVAETRDRKLQVRMVVINHSGAELPDLSLSVALKSTGAKPGDAPITQFNVKLPNIGAYESRELKADATTKLRAYEFPDWQFLRADFEIIEK